MVAKEYHEEKYKDPELREEIEEYIKQQDKGSRLVKFSLRKSCGSSVITGSTKEPQDLCTVDDTVDCAKVATRCLAGCGRRESTLLRPAASEFARRS